MVLLRWWQEPRAGQSRNCKSILKNTVPGWELDVVDEYLDSPHYYEGSEDQFKWLLESVSFREYYRQAGKMALEGIRQHFYMMEQTSRCPSCYE